MTITPFKTVIDGVELEFNPISVLGKNYQVYYRLDGKRTLFHVQRDGEDGEYYITKLEHCHPALRDKTYEISAVIYAQQKQ